ncbi:SMP-30/gluconolactonase/LRE family protein [Streptomyces luomodiensis]|uniref:SMP-30/gluconolactonase/LRE family protein n=1 Tax=Streptomyces luomodiensis TaxID=3026192 RepID=A0ABY9V6P3_9ACTN|nr:SMP-30/gluconolactonase/LRE family protein [Streptomyces sp. SCA4-21]WNF00552.1 SMP-30/gluconolactonase/LRE family protein [Streptomyces sp. SCA4-21]
MPRPRTRPATGAAEPLPCPRVLAPEAHGPEHVTVDARGRILTGTADGAIRRLTLSPARGLVRSEVLAHTGGRPLGLAPCPDGGLLVCDARRGLLRVGPDDGSVTVVADQVAGRPLRFCSNVAAAADGTVYFTVSSRRHGLEDWLRDILENTATGQLLRLRPGGRPEVLLDGLRFANGVALAADESYVAVAESGAYRISRLWLTGGRAGERDVLADDLPGFPDNLTRGPGGLLWVALAGPREPAMELLQRAPVPLRRAVAPVVARVRPRPRPTVRALAFGPDGRVVRHLVRRRAPYRTATSACAYRGLLVLGSLFERGIAVCTLPPREDAPPAHPPPVE